MGLSGKLHTLNLTEILQVLHLYSKSGVLRIQRDSTGEIGELMMREGNIVRAHVSGSTENLCEILLCRGAIDEQQMRRAVELQSRERTTSPIGHLLVGSGATTMKEVGAAMTEQIECALGEMLGWADGYFSFEGLDCPAADNIDYDPRSILPTIDSRKQRVAVQIRRGGKRLTGRRVVPKTGLEPARV